MIETLVLATDGSASVRRAASVATDLAERFDAEVHALYVVDVDEVEAAPAAVRDDLRAGLETRSTDAFDDLPDGVRTEVRDGRPAVEIVNFTDEVDADVVAIGTRGRHGEHRLMLGSVAEDVVRRSPVPVLTVRQLTAGSGSS